MIQVRHQSRSAEVSVSDFFDVPNQLIDKLDQRDAEYYSANAEIADTLLSNLFDALLDLIQAEDDRLLLLDLQLLETQSVAVSMVLEVSYDGSRPSQIIKYCLPEEPLGPPGDIVTRTIRVTVPIVLLTMSAEEIKTFFTKLCINAEGAASVFEGVDDPRLRRANSSSEYFTPHGLTPEDILSMVTLQPITLKTQQ